MMRWFKSWRLWRAKNAWFAVILLLANGLAWMMATSIELVEVEPIRHPHLAEIQDHWRARDAVGETFQVVVTEQEAAETIAWFINDRDNIPFSHPQVAFDPEGITGGGLADVGGLQAYVYGRGTVEIVNGKPWVTVQELGLANAVVPGVVMDVLQSQVERALAYYTNRPIAIELTLIELREGEVYVEGIYR